MAIDILTRLNIPHDSEAIKNIATMPDYMEKLVTNDFKYDYYYQYFSFLKPFIPTKDYIANVEKYATNDWAEFWFNAGQIAGIIPGLAIGIWNLVMAIKDIAVLYGKLQVAQWSAIYAHVSNPVHAVQEDFAWLEKNIPTMVQAITDLFTSKDKNIACIFINLGKFVSAEVCKALTEWSQLDPGRQGYEVGELAGQILFEVAMWCVGVGEVSAAIKGSEATTKVVETLNSLKLGKLAEALEEAADTNKIIKASQKLSEFEKSSAYIKASNAAKEEMLSVIKNYGDTAIDCMVNHGNKSAEIIAKHGKSALPNINEYGKSAIKFYNKFPESVVASDIIKGHGFSPPYWKSRPSYGSNQVEDVWDSAVKNSKDGIVRDKFSRKTLNWDTSKPRNGQWDMGHTQENLFDDWYGYYLKGTISKEDFLKWYREVGHYLPEDVTVNRSHIAE